MELVPAALLAIKPPSEDDLLLRVQANVDRAVLEEISANDRGDDLAKNLAALQAELRPRPPLGLPPWWPLEVLRLEALGEPDLSAKREHLKRLLACTILLRNAGHITNPKKWSDEADFLEECAATLIRLTRSALALDVPRPALGFLLWFLEVQPYPALRPFAAFCVLVLATATGFGRASEQEILAACNWVEAEEQACRTTLGDDVLPTVGWLA